MAPLNDFIDSNRDSLGKFLEKILQKGQSSSFFFLFSSSYY